MEISILIDTVRYIFIMIKRTIINYPYKPQYTFSKKWITVSKCLFLYQMDETNTKVHILTPYHLLNFPSSYGSFVIVPRHSRNDCFCIHEHVRSFAVSIYLIPFFGASKMIFFTASKQISHVYISTSFDNIYLFK